MLDLAFGIISFFVYMCFYFVRFSVFGIMPRDWLGRTSPKLHILCQVGRETLTQLECGPMPNLMVALPNTGGALCSTPQSLADAYY